jgi:hypothetical protein
MLAKQTMFDRWNEGMSQTGFSTATAATQSFTQKTIKKGVFCCVQAKPVIDNTTAETAIDAAEQQDHHTRRPPLCRCRQVTSY